MNINSTHASSTCGKRASIGTKYKQILRIAYHVTGHLMTVFLFTVNIILISSHVNLKKKSSRDTEHIKRKILQHGILLKISHKISFDKRHRLYSCILQSQELQIKLALNFDVLLLYFRGYSKA